MVFILSACAPAEITSIELLRAGFDDLSASDIAPPDVIVDELVSGSYDLPGAPSLDVLEYTLLRGRAVPVRRTDPGRSSDGLDFALAGSSGPSFENTVFRFVPRLERLPNPTGLFIYSFEIRSGAFLADTVGEVRITLDEPTPSDAPLPELLLRRGPEEDFTEFIIDGNTVPVPSGQFQNVVLTLDTRPGERRELNILTGGRTRTIELFGEAELQSAPVLGFEITNGLAEIDQVIIIEATTVTFP
ncbi:MAG: hypothetical protein AAGH74_01415 [Pseudomonadota bacterium]